MAVFVSRKESSDRLLEQLPSGDAANILRRLRRTAQSVNATGVDNAHDLTGRIFQRLIADRKYLATFYTLPASAALLAHLAVAKMEGVGWSSAEAIGRLRIGDFACGTGALLSAVYEQDCRSPRAGRGRCGSSPQCNDGRGAVRLRRHALSRPHHLVNALRCGAVSPLQRLSPVHDALRPDEAQQRDDRLTGASPVLQRADPVQHQRPGYAHRQRGRSEVDPIIRTAVRLK